MNQQHRVYRQATIWSLVLSVPLLITVCVLVAGPRDGLRLAVAFPVQTTTAFVGMLAFCWWAAPRWGPRCSNSLPLAGLFAVGVFFVGALGGTSASMFVYGDYSPSEYIIKPMVWLGLFGLVPAFVVGIVGALVTRRLRQVHARAYPHPPADRR